MIEPLRRTRVVPVTEPLPPGWLRRAPTAHDDDRKGRHVLRVGPGGRFRLLGDEV